MPEAQYKQSPWLKRIWIAVLILQSAVLINVFVAILQRTPDTYAHQHARLATNGAAVWLLAVSHLLDRPLFKYAAIAAAFVALAASIAIFR